MPSPSERLARRHQNTNRLPSLQNRRGRAGQTSQSKCAEGSWSLSPLRSRPCDQESAGSWKVSVVSIMTENKSDPEGEKAEVKGAGKIIPDINCRRQDWERLIFVQRCSFKTFQLSSFFPAADLKDAFNGDFFRLWPPNTVSRLHQWSSNTLKRPMQNDSAIWPWSGIICPQFMIRLKQWTRWNKRKQWISETNLLFKQRGLVKIFYSPIKKNQKTELL